jgi:hypothetical protein
MKKLTLALVVGVMYLGTQATVVFAQKPTGERPSCPECEKASTDLDSKQPAAAAGKPTKRGSGSKETPSANSAHGGGNK